MLVLASKKHLALGSAVLTIGMLVAGCGSSGGSTNDTNATNNSSGSGQSVSGTIVWAAPPITHDPDVRKVLIQEFEKAYPNIKVTLQDQNNNTDTNRASLSTAIGGGSATPDVYLGDVVWPAQFANSQLALPLDEHLPKSFFDRFAPGLVDGATYQGHIYGAPFFADSGFLFYRKDLLDKYHLPVPTSWEQLVSEAKTLQQKGAVQYGFVWQGASYEGLTCNFMEYLADAGGKVLDSNGKAAINSKETEKAVNFMKSLISSGVSPKDEVTFKEDESMTLFKQGKAAFLRNWPYAWNDSQNNQDSKVVGKVGVAPLPTFGGGAGYSCVGGWDLMVNPHTKNLQAVLTFIDWMTGKDAQTILAKQFGEIPTNAEVQKDPEVKKVSPVFDVVSQIHYIARPSQTPNYAQVSQAIYTNINQALSGGVSVQDALKQAQQQIESATGSGGL
jgi:multiple sugar transport system substrate-binding protein